MTTLDHEGRAVLPWWPRVAGRRRPRRAHRDVAAAGAAPRPRAPRPGGARRDRAARRDRRAAARRSASAPSRRTASSATRRARRAAEGDALLARARRRPRRAPSTAGWPTGAGDDDVRARRARPAGRRAATSSSAARRCGCSASPTPASRVFDDIAAGLDIAAGRRRPTGSSTASSTPAPSTRDPTRRPVHAPPTSPSSCRRSCSASRRWPRSCAAAPASPASSPSTTPPTRRSAPSPGSRVLRLRTNAGPAVARNAGLGAVDDAARRVRRHRRPPRAGLARAAARPTSPTSASASSRHASPARRAPGRSPPTSRATRRSTSAPSRAASPRAPASATSRRRRSSCAPTRCARSTASTASCASARTSTPCGASSRPAGAAATSRRRVVHHRPRGSWRALVAQRVAYGSSAAPAGRAPPRRAGPGAHQRVERRGVGPARRRPADPGPRRRRRHDGWRSCASCPASRPRTRCGSPGSATSTPGGCSPTPAGGRGGRCCSPAPLVSKRVRAASPSLAAVPALLSGGIPKLVDDLAYGAGLWKGVVAEREPGPLRPRFTSWPGPLRRGAEPRPGRPVPSRGVTLRLTVDADAWRAHVERTSPGRCPGSSRSSRATATGSAAAALAAIAAELVDTIAVGTVHELDHVPAGVTPVVLTPTRRPPADAVADPHRRLARPRPRPRRLAGPGASSSWRRRCAASARRATTLGAASTAAARGAGLDVVGFGVHPPVAGTDDEHLDDIAAWLDAARPDRRGVGQPPVRRRPTATCATRGPTAASASASAPPCGTATRRRCTSAPTCSTSAPSAAGDHAGYRQGVVPVDGDARDGRRRHRPRRAPARRRAQPVPLRPPPPRAARAAAHAHVDGVRAGRRADAAAGRRRRRAAAAHHDRSSTRCAGDDRDVDRAAAPAVAAGDARLPGPDVVRAVALIGVVVMNFHGYLLLRGDTRGDDAVERVLRSVDRAAVDAVRGDVRARRRRRRHAAHPPRRSATATPPPVAKRWTLVRRGLALYGGGLLLDMIWPGTILPYYGAMFVVAAVLFTLRTPLGRRRRRRRRARRRRRSRWWRLERRLDGHDTDAGSSTPGAGLAARPRARRRRQRHPPAAAVAGVLLRRHRARPRARRRRRGGRRPSAAALALFGVATFDRVAAGDGAHAVAAEHRPVRPRPAYTASALGTALVAFGRHHVAGRALRRRRAGPRCSATPAR